MTVGASDLGGEPWRDVYDQHAGDLFGFLARRVGRDLAEDLLAETFAVAIESVESFDHTLGSPRTWLFGIASNLVRRHWRTEQRRLHALARDSNVSMNPSAVDSLTTSAVISRVDAAADAAVLITELGRLDVIDRELLALTGWEELSSADAGAALGIPAATVRSRIRRARARLRNAVDRGGVLA